MSHLERIPSVTRAVLGALWFLAFAGCATVGPRDGAGPAPESPASRPNVIFIMADDMGYGDVGVYNDESKIPTPNLDRLAGEGMRFTDARVPSSLCTPVRYALLTGRYAWRGRLKRGVIWGVDHPLIEPERTTVASFLRDQGYATACIGKWHLGLGWTTLDGDPGPWPDRSLKSPHDNGWNIDYAAGFRGGPIELGFDYFFGVAASNNMAPFCWLENDRVLVVPTVRKHPLRVGQIAAPMVEGWDDRDYGPKFTETAVEFLERHQRENPERPFFLYVPATAPHRPCVPPDFVQGKSEAGRRGDMVVEFDWTVGQILETLDRLGLAERTLLIATSDNGATPGDPFPPGSGVRSGTLFGMTYDHKSNGDWRGYKSQIWEGGLRVPFVARWPGQVPAGTVSDVPVSLVDFLATIADAVGAALPEGSGDDGLSLLPTLRGEADERLAGRALIHQDAAGRFAVREGEWKYIPASDAGRNHLEEQLFNLRLDPGESESVLADHPDVAKRLAARLEEIRGRE